MNEIGSTTIRHGIVVKIDGGDGCGKSTLVKDLASMFSHFVRVVTTEEFCSIHDYRAQTDQRSISRLMYELSLDPLLQFDDIERQLAMTIAAHRHNRIVLPCLSKQFDLVLCDRSFLTNYAAGAELGQEYTRFVNWALEQNSVYDVIFWIDVRPSVAFLRRTRTLIESETIALDPVEQKGLEHQVNQHEAFRDRCRRMNRVIRIAGEKDYSFVLRDVANRMQLILNDSGYSIPDLEAVGL
jgi:thymidylate kinase